jgi:ectoine hydroxylase-related dioxygenase (phytanoyl-CoA dioxygenase family)
MRFIRETQDQSSVLNQPTSAQIASYRVNGFIAIEGFLSPDELNIWREVTDQAVRQRLESRGSLTNQSNPDDYYAQVFTQCLRLADSSPAMRELIYDRRLGQIAGELAGARGLRIWHDQALIKPPCGNPTGWHLDNPYWSFNSRDSISIWIALDDATLANGCLFYLPGTHLTARFDNHGIGSNLGGLFNIYPEWMKIDPVPVPVPAGTAVFHNGLTAHAAGANMTNKPRRAMTCAFMPDGSAFNGQRNILPEALFKKYKVGDVLNDDTFNPLIWQAQT